MTFSSKATYYLTLLGQMIIFTFVYHHISKPKKGYRFTVCFYFACVAAVHIIFLPLGNDYLLKPFPHLMLILAQFPVLFLYRETNLRSLRRHGF